MIGGDGDYVLPEGITGDTPLREVKDWLYEQVLTGGVCPCCEQKAKVYRRSITGPMARGLIKQYREAGREFAHTASLVKSETHEASQLSWWGLLEDASRVRPDGGKAGWWRISELGAAFARNEVRVPKYVYVYASKVVRVDPKKTISITEALGVEFDYRELMRGNYPPLLHSSAERNS